MEFRRSSHSFSLTDVPLTPALIFASGTGALVAIFLGTLVALGMCRLPPVKFAFNVAQFSLVTAVLLMVIHTGYSSLSYLRNLPLDTLKIAREFVDGLAFSDHDAAFVRLIVGLDKTVGLKVVAEGIETRAQLDILGEIGCEFGQGYYFAQPMDGDAD